MNDARQKPDFLKKNENFWINGIFGKTNARNIVKDFSEAIVCSTLGSSVRQLMRRAETLTI